MVKINIDIIEFLKFGKVNGHKFIGENKQLMIELLSQPEQVEEHSDLGLTDYYYGPAKFLVSKSIIESIVINGDAVGEYKQLSRIIGLLLSTNTPFSFDKSRSDTDYLIMHVGDQGHLIIETETQEIYKISYPFL